jgi:hypothetical protein
MNKVPSFPSHALGNAFCRPRNWVALGCSRLLARPAGSPLETGHDRRPRQPRDLRSGRPGLVCRDLDHVPADTHRDFHFPGHPQTSLRFYLNGQQVASGDWGSETASKDFISIQPDPTKPPIMASIKTLTLDQGWNEVFMRGYCLGYPPFRAGLIFERPPEKLWTLQLSGTSPATP